MTVGCTKDNQDPQENDDITGSLIPRKLTEAASNDSMVFIYDNQNHLLETHEYSGGSVTSKTVYTYQNGNPVKSEYYSEYPGGITEYYENTEVSTGKIKQDYHYITADNSWHTWTVYYFFDDKGRITKGEWEDGTVFQQLTWDAQNRVTALWYKESFDLSYIYKYDDKKGMFSGVNNPFFFDAFLDIFPRNFGVNNLTELTETYVNGDGVTKSETDQITYKYNEQGYPVEMHSGLDQVDALYFIEYQDAKKL